MEGFQMRKIKLATIASALASIAAVAGHAKVW
jgi:hypothetical protein